jgi:creatinine amidohydrolase/Fe(II)-dependent formamide hydrolase-like protein
MTPYHRLTLALLTSFMLASCTPQDQGQTQTLETEAVDSVFLEELTWVEVRDALASGKTTILIPTGGVEQNGPHMALGKHNAILEVTMERVARRLGDTLVAPIVTYVPEGDIDPPSGHMRFPGTITLPPEHFAMLLEYAARSLAAHGFRDIVLIGDSGGNQESMREVSELLNQEWEDSDSRVHFVGEYYSANGFREWLESQGETEEGIGRHAGITDTSQLMVAAPHLVRADKVALEGGFEGSGVRGDPTRASVEYGRKGLEMKVETAVAKIRELRSSSR